MALLALGLSYSYVSTDFVVTPLIFGLFILISVSELYWFLRRQERNWSRFLLSIEHHDFTRSYQQFYESKKLRDAYELITSNFEQLRQKQESDELLLKTLLRHIPIGLACYNEQGEAVFSNDPFLFLLGRKKAPPASQLKYIVPKLDENVLGRKTGPGETIEQMGQLRLLIKTESFSLLGFEYKLLSMMDISHTLDVNELESYQKLMRVMTHEIMNSTAPVLSLIKVVNQKLIGPEGLNELTLKDQSNIGKSLMAIETRTAGILSFVEAYRKMNKPIVPQLETISTVDLLESVIALVDDADQITLEDRYRGPLLIDNNLIAQVLINLLKNAKEAVGEMEEGRVKLRVYQADSHIRIEVVDSGPGVKPENIHKIFIPFFTTKEQGSGVGLALSRKIVKAHGGGIEYERIEKESRFRISIPK